MSKRTGNQEPTFQHVTEYDNTDSDLAIGFFKDIGFNLLQWQKLQMQLMLAVVFIGDFVRVAAKSICFSVPRQNGKSFACRLYAIWCAVVLGKKVLYSAHNGKTCRKFFKMLEDLFTNKQRYPDFYNSVALDGRGHQRINRQRGEEGIYFKNGGYIEFITRTNSGARGDSVDVLIIDEAQEYTSAMQEAIKPCLSAGGAGDSQTIYIGTPITPTCHGDVWANLHNKAHSDNPGNTWWIEWGYDGEIDYKITADELFELAWKYNPGMGGILNSDDIRDEAETMSIDGFFRERLGWWSRSSAADNVFSIDEWNSTLVKTPPNLKELNHIITYGIKISPDDREIALSVAIRWVDEHKRKNVYVELREVRPKDKGTKWIVDFLTQRKSSTAFVLIDGRNGADKLRTDLIDAGFPKVAVKVAETSEAIDSTSLLKDLNTESLLFHCPSKVLDDSAVKAQKRLIGNSGGYGYADGGGDSTPLSSAALAVYAAYTTKRNPKRKQKLLGHGR